MTQITGQTMDKYWGIITRKSIHVNIFSFEFFFCIVFAFGIPHDWSRASLMQ